MEVPFSNKVEESNSLRTLDPGDQISVRMLSFHFCCPFLKTLPTLTLQRGYLSAASLMHWLNFNARPHFSGDKRASERGSAKQRGEWVSVEIASL